uniref:Protein E6-like n=1 Tax=Kalanchoe fedtschenkoi TaxID=63787 RepID=A0A7N0SVA0_KALFE
MASCSSFAAFLLLITISAPLLQIHARESQFFSKMVSKPTDTVVLPDKQKEQQSLVNSQVTEQQQQQQQQEGEQPEFVPQNQNGYGLYGHETGLQTETPGTYSTEKYFNNDRVDGGRTEQFQNSNGETFYTHNNGEKYTPSSDDEDLLNFDSNYAPTSGGDKKDDLLNFDDKFDNNGETETFYTNNRNGVETERYAQTQQDDNNGETETFYNNNHNGVVTEHYAQTQKHNKDFGGSDSLYSDNQNTVVTGRYTQTQKGDDFGSSYYKPSSDEDDNAQFGSQLSQAETDNSYYTDKRFDTGFTNELNTRYDAYRRQFQNREESKAERQGMSDTRFLENGRFYYDLEKERNQNQYATKNTYNPNYSYDKVDEASGSYYGNGGAEKHEFDTMEEYERSRQNQYDP